MDHASAHDPRSLSALRETIDATDRDILRLLSRRAALIAEVADYKRHHGLAIRDAARESQIIEDRRNYATALGLSPNVIESIYRLIMWESRDRQAALRAEVPYDLEARTVAIIGGMGQMGQCFARLFGDLGHRVVLADLKTGTTPEEAASSADVVIISVPISETVSVIEHLGPLVRPDALLMDVTSIKVGPMAAMLRSTSASVVGTHPMFGPAVHSLQGQRVILCPGRGAPWEDWLRRMLHARGLVVKDAAAADHDRAMAIVQVLVHYRTEVMGRTLVKLGVSIRDTLSFTSPIYLLELLTTARQFGQSSDLYASIAMSNSASDEVLSAFLSAAGEVRELIVSQDREGFRGLFEDVRTYFGDFTGEAMELSSYLIDRLVERA